MPEIKVNQVEETGKQALPLFQEISKRLEAVRHRAFELFQKRGDGAGDEFTDWLQAEHEIFGWPTAELSRKNHVYTVQVTLPGFEAKDIEVTTTPNELFIHAAAKREEKGEEKGVVWTEFGSNDVYRRFELPGGIQTEKVVANLDKGILKITAPMVEQPGKAPAERSAKAAA